MIDGDGFHDETGEPVDPSTIEYPKWHPTLGLDPADEKALVEAALKPGAWYHGSPACLSPGDVLTPQDERNFRQSKPGVVSLSSDPETALHWAREAAKVQGKDHTHVYEVEPLGQKTPWRVRDGDFGQTQVWEEIHVPSARVVRMVFGHGVDELPPPHMKDFMRDSESGFFVKRADLSAEAGKDTNVPPSEHGDGLGDA